MIWHETNAMIKLFTMWHYIVFSSKIAFLKYLLTTHHHGVVSVAPTNDIIVSAKAHNHEIVGFATN